jgi:acyl carrier protein
MSAKSQQEILAIIQKALAVDDPISLDSAAASIPEWDSLGQINIIVALDEALGGGVSELPEMATAASVRRILEILVSKNLAASA